MVDGEVKLNIKADVDLSSLRKQYQKAAESARMNLNKTIRDFDVSVSKSLKDAADDAAAFSKSMDLDIFTRAADALKVIDARLNEIKQGADSIDLVTAHLGALEQELSKTSRDILKLSANYERMQQAAAMKGALISDYGSIEKAKEAYAGLGETVKNLQRALIDKGFGYVADMGPDTIAKLDAQNAKIEEARQALARLKAERDKLAQSPDAGTTEGTKQLAAYDAQIQTTIRDLANLSKQFYKTARDAGWKFDNKAIQESYNQIKELEQANERVVVLGRALKEVKLDAENTSETMGKLGKYSDKFNSLVSAIKNIGSATAEVNEEAEQTTINFSQWRNAVWSVSRVLGSVYTLSLDVVRGAKMIANFYKTLWGYAKRVLSVFKAWRGGIVSTAVEHAKSFKTMIRDVLRYAFGIRSLFALFRRLRKYIKEAFEEMAKQIPEVEKTLSGLKSSLGMLKGSLATAFEPILSAVAPMLNILIEKLSQAMTYIGMFFAALTGRGYVYQATKSMQNFTKETKKAKEQLQKFDELNNITTNKNKDDDEAPIAIFKKVPVPDWIKDLADKIKNIINQIIGPIKKAWALVGEYVKWAWLRAFNAVKKFLLDIGKDFLRAWEKWGTPIFIRIFQIVGDIGETIANIAEALDEAWNANDNGYKIWNAILEIIYKIASGIRRITKDVRDWAFTLNLTPAMTAFREWLESLVPVIQMVMDILYDFWNDTVKPIITWAFDGEDSGLARFFNILRNFNNMLDKSKIQENLDKIWKALGNFGVNVGEGLLDFMDRMLRYLGDWLNSDEFAEWCDTIANFLNNIEPEDIAEKLEQIARIIGNIISSLFDAIEYVKEFNFLGRDILDWIEILSENLDRIAKLAVFGKLTIDLIRFAANIALMVGAMYKFLGPTGLIVMGVIGLVAAIAGYVVAFVDMWRNGINDVEAIFMSFCGVIATVLAGLVFGPVGALVAAIIVAIAGIVLIIHDNWDKIVAWWTGTAWPAIQTFLWDCLRVVVAVLEAIWVTIQTAFYAIVGIVTGIISTIVGIISGAVDLIVNTVLGIINTIISILEAVWITIKSIIEAIVTGSTEPLGKIKEAWVNVFTSIKDLLKGIWNGIASIIEGAINGILKGIEVFVNGVIGAANRAASAIASVPGFSGSIRQFATISMPRVSIPRLAEGAVIPPNKEFLAVLGDQKSGTNIESPLSTMVEAFNQAGGNRSEQELTLLQEQNQLLRQLIEKEWSISASQMFNAMQRQAVVYTKQSGKPAFS